MSTDYAGTGFGRLTPYNSVQAVVSLYIMGLEDQEPAVLFRKFIKEEHLDSLEFLYTITLPPYYNGRVNKVQIGNILLTGRSAGLIESLIGTGSVESLASGVLAARAIADNEDYTQAMKPLQKHTDNISAFRKVLNGFDNKDFDKLISIIDTPVIKQLLYSTRLNFADLVGAMMKHFQN